MALSTSSATIALMALAPASARPLQLGALTLPSPVLVAPMAGISDAPFREIAVEMGAGLTTTEMVAAEAVVRSQEASVKLLDFPAGVEPVAAQLVGSDPQVMAAAAQLCVERGAIAVDVNLGCPVRKVVGLGNGAARLRSMVQGLDSPERLEELFDLALASGERPEGWFAPVFTSGEG